MLRTSRDGGNKGRKTAVHGALADVSHAARAAVGGSDTMLASPPPASALVFRAIALMLVTSFAAGAALATQDSLPDSPLHDVKIATEEVRLSLAQSSGHLVAVELDIAQARLREAAVLQAQDRQVEAEAAISAYGEHVANAAAHFEESATGAGSAALIQFRAQVIKQQQSIPAPSPKRTGTVVSETPLGIAAEVAAAISQDNRAGAQEIAVAAAQAADKAATNIEKKAAPIIQTTPKLPVAPPTNAPEASRASASAPTVVVPAAATPSAPTTTSSPALAPATPSSSTPAVQANSSVPTAESDMTRNDKAKTEAAAKTARESADRAKQAADRAKQAAQKTGRDGK
jgi:uncharacterized protein DUF5667